MLPGSSQILVSHLATPFSKIFDYSQYHTCLKLFRKNMEEDEVNSVAQLLGDLVTYRATGTGHLEFLAGSLLF